MKTCLRSSLLLLVLQFGFKQLGQLPGPLNYWKCLCGLGLLSLAKHL